MWTRFLPHIAEVNRLLAAGVLGEIVTVTADHGQWVSKDPAFRLFAPALGGGAPTAATIVGTEARIEIDGIFYAPSPFTMVGRDGSTTRFEPPYAGKGLHYEADEVARRLRAGLMESPLMPLDESISIMETMDAVVAQTKVG